MAKLKKNTEAEAVNSFRFSLTGLIVFSLFLMAGTALISSRLSDTKPKPFSFANNNIPDPDAQDKNLFTHTGPWGELLTQNIKLERPAEYISTEVKSPEPESWNFNTMNLAQVKALLAGNGLPKEQVEAQLTPNRIATAGTTTVLTPDR